MERGVWKINSRAVSHTHLDVYKRQAYGDVLENIWAIDWFLDGLRVGEGLRLFAPHIFMPEGWALSTFANGLGVFALAVPIAALTGAAVAFNVCLLYTSRCV